MPKLKVVGITGSYGKTTVKETLWTVLSEKFKVLKTSENINTPIGISRLILDSLTPDVEIFIVEMGAYRRGDIKILCQIAPPDVAILTGINEAHLSRFGSIENTIAAKFEIVSNSKPNAIVYLNEDNKLINDNYKEFQDQRQINFYNSKSSLLVNLKSGLLGGYAIGVLNVVTLVGKHLGLSEDQIRNGISNVKSVSHRLQLIESSNGVTVIDDSYNGNPDGVAEAVKVLASYSNRRKIYLTPGLVEMGDRARSIHQNIGEMLAPVADLVVLIKNSVTPFIAEGLVKQKFSLEKIMWFDSALKAHENLGKILKSGDVILFQNDWPENYV